MSDVDLPGAAGDRARARIDRLVEVDLAEQRLFEDRINPIDPDAPFQEHAQRIVRNAKDVMFVSRERAIEGRMTDEQLDQMAMSFTEVLAFDAARSDPRAPRFVRNPALQARRRELDARIEQIRARRALGLPDEPERTDTRQERARQPPAQTRPVGPAKPLDVDYFED